MCLQHNTDDLKNLALKINSIPLNYKILVYKVEKMFVP
jgi:hypothetical protein